MSDLESLLAPVSEDAPSGEDLSFSPEFDAIENARRADDPTLEQGAWVTDIKYADWTTVLRGCEDLLATRTKDLRLAAWYTEAKAKLQGFEGLSIGYRLVAGLCDRYWDALHPIEEDSDYEQRLGNLSWLLVNSLQWMRSIPIAHGPQGQFNMADFELAHSRARDSVEALDGSMSLDAMEAARRDTSHDFYRQVLAVLPECGVALQDLQVSVDARLGIDGPSFSAARDELDNIYRTVQRFARDAGLLVDGEHGVDDAGPVSFTGESSEGQAQPAQATGPITSRKDALMHLRMVAEYFRKTEPHSPVAYLADKAAKWGEMPLHIWLRRVIKDPGTLSQVEEMLDTDPQDPFNP